MASLTAAASPSPDKKAISDHHITLTHRTIVSKRSFGDTKAALESAIPPLDTSFVPVLAAGDTADGLALLQALPTLNNFILPPRDVGVLASVWGVPGKRAVQYEIGNPYTASKLVRFNLGVSLYVPIRVALIEDHDGVAKFVFDRPTSLFGQFKEPGIKPTAEALDDQLTQLFLFCGGWPSDWPIAPLP
ncbi:hypothetical protein QBC47DRAFT_413590 [Echria macrotheca]|uniref:DUF302 domain-containing protein n=1 Tax=Echria macrotheca TaxID=438768 RepID=A0AAJ0BHA7_9PEZI|nr:hypothetical protein QBC47DRAFT_413590 [Echria macrotheca]